LRAISKAKRWRTKKPLLAAIVVEMAATKGIASPKACGQAITKTETTLSKAKPSPAFARSHSKKVIKLAETAITVR
jgi:hypothetical protein